MATDVRKNSTGTKLPNFSHPRMVLIQETVDYADLLVAKESALAAADVFNILTIPAGCIVLYAGLTPKVVGDSTTLTLDLGDGDNDDLYVDGTDGAALTDGVPIMTVSKYYPAAGSLNLLFKTLTGTLTTGKVLVWALVTEASVL